jgi:hypothetical protein
MVRVKPSLLRRISDDVLYDVLPHFNWATLQDVRQTCRRMDDFITRNQNRLAHDECLEEELEIQYVCAYSYFVCMPS